MMLLACHETKGQCDHELSVLSLKLALYSIRKYICFAYLLFSGRGV